jgi:hypothetical protein
MLWFLLQWRYSQSWNDGITVAQCSDITFWLQWRYSQPRNDGITVAQCSDITFWLQWRYSQPRMTALLWHSAQILRSDSSGGTVSLEWRHYCGTVLRYYVLTPVEVQSVSLALATLLRHCSDITFWLQWSTVSLALTALLRHSAQILRSASSGGTVSLALTSLLRHSAQILRSDSNEGTVSLALTALLRHNVQILRSHLSDAQSQYRFSLSPIVLCSH